MMLETSLLVNIPEDTLKKYYCGLISKIFKILPLAEEDRSSAKTYLNGFHLELTGVQELLTHLQDDPRYVSLLGIIAWLRDHMMDDDCSLTTVKREVFAAISVCKKLECESHGGDCDG